jgi:nicotinate-nucleotide adenylyltransferase
MKSDLGILEAIKKHTTCDLKMSSFEKLIYLADKLCIGRKFTGIQKERDLAHKDLDAAFVNAIARSCD